MKLQELLEEKDPATSILVTVSKTLKAMGFKKSSAEDTRGVKRIWFRQPVVKIDPRVDEPKDPGYETQDQYEQKKLDALKYSFMSKESINKFIADFEKDSGAKLKDLQRGKIDMYSGLDVKGDGFDIQSQNSDVYGQVVVAVAKKNKSGAAFKQGYDT